MPVSFYLLLAVTVYCVVRAIDDFWRRRIAWGVLDLVAALVIVSAPVPSHAVKVDLPVNAAQ